MSMNDPIADMLTRVRNANSAGKQTVSMPSSKKLVEIARIMQEEGYVAGYEVVEGEPRATLEITLKYGEKKAKTIRHGMRWSNSETFGTSRLPLSRFTVWLSEKIPKRFCHNWQRRQEP